MTEQDTQVKLSRRDLFKAAGTFALGTFVLENKGLQVASAQEQVPTVIKEIFTSDPKEVNSMQHDQITLMSTFEDESGVSAILNMTPDGAQGIPSRLQLAKYDASTSQFGQFQEIGRAPMNDSEAIALLPGETEHTLGILAGVNEGHTQLDANGEAAVPRLFFSGDEGRRFDEIDLTDQNGEKLSHGMILDVRRIPQSRIGLVQVILPNRETGYGIVDSETKQYIPIPSESSVPILDDITLSKDGLILSGVGRVVERDSGGFQKLKAISRIEIDLQTNTVISNFEIYQNDEAFAFKSMGVRHDEQGDPTVGYAVQKYTTSREGDRHYYKIDLQTGEVQAVDYGPILDQIVLKYVRPEQFMPKELFVGSFPVVTKITPVAGGNLFTGRLQIPQAGSHPMAVFIPEGVDPVNEIDKVINWPFNELRIFPGEIKQIEIASFPSDPFARNQESPVPNHGFLLNMSACGQAFIPTNEKYEPIGSEVLYAIKSQG
ncbi:MAG: hypothetical protein AAB478_04230 [Patescibacteria group bacterium]